MPTFDTSTDLGLVLPSKRNADYIYRLLCNGYSLRNRFDGLPLHRVCYYHSHDTEEVAIEKFSIQLTKEDGLNNIDQSDILGMTPLHILACSTKHHLDMYQMLLSRYPGHVYAKDKWGDVPLLYLIWGRAPWDIVEFVARSMNTYRETYLIDWEKMIETFCVGLAPTACLEYLFETSRRIFPNQKLEVDWNHMIRLLCTKGKASAEHVQQFMQTTLSWKFAEDFEMVSFELAEKEKFGFKPFWLRIGISERLSSLEKDEWKEKIELMIKKCPTGSSERNVRHRFELMKKIIRKLAFFETVAQLWVLELTLWKAKLGELENSTRQSKSYRSRCLVTCGADIIVPNVMAYLLDLTEK